MPLNVLIAGAGPAGLEAALALRELAGDRVSMTLLAPEDELVYRPLSVADPFAIAATRRYALDAIARDVGAQRAIDTLAAVDPGARTVRTGSGADLPYDALLIALGAKSEPAVARATTFWGPEDAEHVHGLVQDVEGGYSRRVAFVVPPGATWPLPLYELALLLSARAYDIDQDPELHLITPEDTPLGVFGHAATQSIAALLEEARIKVHTGTYVEVLGGQTLALRPAGIRLQVDRVVALPRLVGRPVPGLEVDDAGFLSINEHGRVRGVDDVWAAGDITDFPVKQGGIATQQADTAACDIAARAGADVSPEPFRPVLRGVLLTGRGAWWMRAQPDDGEGEIAGHALWWPPSKIAGLRLAPYLAERDEQPSDAPPRGTPLEVRLASGTAPADEEGAGRVVEVLSLEHPPPPGTKESG